MTILLIPAVLSTKQCHDYVGGSLVWQELLAAHGDILKPLRTVARGDSYWQRETVDGALRVAQAMGTLLYVHTHPPVLTKTNRRFKKSA